MDPYREAIETRIRELHQYRRWMRSRYDRPFWRGLEREYRREAGALNSVRNRVRRVEQKAVAA